MKRTVTLFTFIAIMLLGIKCSTVKKVKVVEPYTINLKWYPSYETETQAKVKTGLKWIMAYLGANDLASNFDHAASWKSDNVIVLDVEPLGFDQRTLDVWKIVLNDLKASKAYRNDDFLDIGAFVMKTFTNTWTYYALTGVEQSYSDFVGTYDFSGEKKYIVKQGESCVSSLNRLINVAQGETITETAFISSESISTKLGKEDVKELEVFDFMRNGQIRFAIYDQKGALKAGADGQHSIAGKPSKCMWCHESQIAKLRFVKSSVEGFENARAFKRLIRKKNKQLRTYFRENDQQFVLDSARHHSYAELLYVNYQTPTLTRLRNEGYQEEEIDAIRQWVHPNEEYWFLDSLIMDSVVYRSALDSTFNLTSRETNANELNIFEDISN